MLEDEGYLFVILELEACLWGRLLGESFHRRTGAILFDELGLSAFGIGYGVCLG